MMSNEEMKLEFKLNWTACQWRQFIGLADITPMVELASVVSDRLFMALIDERLEHLGSGGSAPQPDEAEATAPLLDKESV